ncbi:UDP-galactose transporter [Binucleata daphniae]
MSVKNGSYYGIIAHALGIYTCFLGYGIIQEKLITKSYNGVLFTNFVFLTFFQNMIAVLVSFIICTVTKKRLHIRHPNPLPSYIKVSALQFISGQLAYKSLKYINYPTLIIGKSCKLIPLVLMNFLLYKKKFHLRKYISILMTTAGVLSFMLFEDKTCTARKNSALGLALLIANLLCDGTINSLQGNLFAKHRIHSLHMMYYNNLISMIITFLYLYFTNKFIEGVVYMKCASLFTDMVLYSFLQVIGQLFIYSTIENYGSVTLATINVSRKIVSILISLILFKHKLNLMQWISILTVFASFGFEFLEKNDDKKQI